MSTDIISTIQRENFKPTHKKLQGIIYSILEEIGNVKHCQKILVPFLIRIYLMLCLEMKEEPNIDELQKLCEAIGIPFDEEQYKPEIYIENTDHKMDVT